MSTLTVYSDTGDGRIISKSDASWADARAGANLVVDTNDLSKNVAYARYIVGDFEWGIVRGYFRFATSVVPDSAIISECITSMYGVTYAQTSVRLMLGPTWAGANLATGDWEGDVAGTLAADAAESWDTGQYNDFPENAAGIADINLTGQTYRATWESTCDYADASPSPQGTTLRNNAYYADNGSNKPKMFITYTSGTITITSPDGGEDYDQGTKTTVTWTFTGSNIENVKIEISALGGAPWTELVASTDADNEGAGSGSWELNFEAAQEVQPTYKIQITGIEHAAVDTSDAAFAVSARTISTPNPPAASVEWGVGKTHNITFAYTGTGGEFTHVNIIYNNGSDHTIEANVALTGSPQTYSWVGIPDAAAVAGNDAITIIVEDNSADVGTTPASGISAALTVYKLDQSLLDPAGAEYLSIGSMHTWEWGNKPAAADGAANVKLWYCTDFSGAKTWQTLSASQTNDGTESIEVPNDPSVDCGFKVEELDGELLSVEIAAAFTIGVLIAATLARARRVLARLTIDGNDIPVRHWGVEWEVDGNIITRTVTVQTNRRALTEAMAYINRPASFRHGILGGNGAVSFEGQVVKVDPGDDDFTITILDLTHYLASERIEKTADLSGWSTTGLIRWLIEQTGRFSSTFHAETPLDITRMPPELAQMLPGKKGTSAVNDLLEATWKMESMTSVTEYYLINWRSDIARIVGVPELDAMHHYVPSPETISTEPIVQGITGPTTRVLMVSSDDADIEATFINTAVEEVFGPSPWEKKSYPSSSEDLLHTAAIHYGLLRRKPRCPVSIEIRGGYFLMPLMSLDLSAFQDVPVDSAYILSGSYAEDLLVTLELDSRRPSIIDLLS